MTNDTANEIDINWMQYAIQLAQRAEDEGEVPVGAVVVLDNELIGEGWNQVIGLADPSAHAEVQALRSAAKRVGNYRLPEATLYVTLEPCMMCAGTMVHARLFRVVFGAYDPKTGVLESRDNLLESEYHNHAVSVSGGILQAECSTMLKAFFRKRRELKKKNRDQEH